MKPPKYTAEQVDEIIERIAILRMRWLSVVNKQLASQARDDEPDAVEGRESPSDAMIIGRIIFFAAGNKRPLKGRRRYALGPFLEIAADW